MNKLLKINEVATRYKISKRTLRYYEEIGILSSIRKDNSNYRYYDSEALSKLEQILLLKSLNFKISEIGEIMISKDEEFIENKLQDKLIKIKNEMDNLYACKNIISSIMKVKHTHGTSNINFYEIIREQVYIHKKIERRIHMKQFEEDMIILEFGTSIIPCANELIKNIKEFRNQIESAISSEIPLIRMRDNEVLENEEYRILIKDVIIEDEIFEKIDDSKKIIKIIDSLKKAINSNLDSILK